MLLWTCRKLAADLLARCGTYPLRHVVSYLPRSARIVFNLKEYKALLQLDVYLRYYAKWSDNVLRHLTHHHYLCKDLSMAQRAKLALAHYQFEDAHFDDAYKTKVYLGQGICLWRHDVTGSSFSIVISASKCWEVEGDLTIRFLLNETCLHTIGFNWVPGKLLDCFDNTVLFLARNQGRGPNSDEALAVFEAEFPQNSPSFFCFSAVQGLALAMGMTRVIGIKHEYNVCFDGVTQGKFYIAYDGFWRSLGATTTTAKGYTIALPFYTKPITEVAAKRRKRALMRRFLWNEISNSALLAMKPHIVVKLATS